MMECCKVETNTPGEHLEHDLFRWGGLGKTGRDVYYTLFEMGEATAAELATAANVGRMTVYRKLEAMESVNMVERIGKGKYQALEVDFDTVARLLGMAGKGRAQRKRHRQERRLQRALMQRGRIQ
jgi:sugar-specific transcriptional regulator TrmB